MKLNSVLNYQLHVLMLKRPAGNIYIEELSTEGQANTGRRLKERVRVRTPVRERKHTVYEKYGVNKKLYKR